MYVLTGIKIMGGSSSRLIIDQLEMVVNGATDEQLMSPLTSKLTRQCRFDVASWKGPFVSLVKASPPVMDSFSDTQRDDFRVLLVGHEIINAIDAAMGFQTDDPLYVYWNPRPPFQNVGTSAKGLVVDDRFGSNS